MIMQTGMTDSDRLLELQERSQAEAHTGISGAGRGGAAPAPANLPWAGGGWVWGNLTGLL